MGLQADNVPSMCILAAEPQILIAQIQIQTKSSSPSSDTLQFCDYLSICNEHTHYPLSPIFLTSKASEIISTAQSIYVS